MGTERKVQKMSMKRREEMKGWSERALRDYRKRKTGTKEKHERKGEGDKGKVRKRM